MTLIKPGRPCSRLGSERRTLEIASFHANGVESGWKGCRFTCCEHIVAITQCMSHGRRTMKVMIMNFCEGKIQRRTRIARVTRGHCGAGSKSTPPRPQHARLRLGCGMYVS